MKLKKFNEVNEHVNSDNNEEIKFEIQQYIQRINEKVYSTENSQILDFIRNDLSDIIRTYKI